MLRKAGLVFGSMLSCVLLVGAANAAPITPGPTFDLTVGSEYDASPTTGQVIAAGADFSFDYFFNVTSDVNAQILASSFLPFPAPSDPKIANLTLTWLDETGTAIPGAVLTVTSDSGQTIAGSLLYTLLSDGDAAFDYILRVTGLAANGGRYDFDLNGLAPASSQLPLPSTLFLFGTTLVGGIALLRRRRASRASHSAP
jgi:hypothetical protein